MLKETKILMLLLAIAAAAPVWADNDHNYTLPKGLENIMLFNPHEYDISQMTAQERAIFELQRREKQAQHQQQSARVMPTDERMVSISGL